jgi:thiol-disulfide isomerase/thioredoxin
MIIRKAMLALLCALCAGPLMAQDEETEERTGDSGPTLTIGSEAPALDIEHWVQDGDGKFKPVTKFEDGKVYVVEFWATWCGPCIASMPHLAETQEEYADKGVQIISVSDEDLETVEKFLERDVKGEEDQTYKDLTSKWCLTTDPDKSVQVAYMRAASQNGIPTAFIVGKSGEIEWIGHPMTMDEPLEKIVDDSWDREAFAVEFRAQQEIDILLADLGSMLQDDPEGAVAKLDEAIEKYSENEAQAAMVDQLRNIRTRVVITTGHEDAPAAIRELAMDADAETLNGMAWTVVEREAAGEEVSKDLLAAATEAAEKAVEKEPEAGHIIDTLAHLVYLQGDLDRAIELTEKAAELSGDQFPEIHDFLKKLKKEKEDGADKAGDDDGV